MRRGFKVGLLGALAVLGLVLDQWTKTQASDRLATARAGAFEHPLVLTVPPRFDGRPARELLAEELAWSRPGERRRVARRYLLDADTGAHLGPETLLREGQRLAIRRRVIVLIDGLLELEYTRNPGAALGFLAGLDARVRLPVLLAVAALAIMVLLALLRSARPEQRALIVGLGCIAGGALGNVVDRLRHGYVIDFILLKLGDAWRWPVFNVADALIVGGVTLMVAAMFRDNLDLLLMEPDMMTPPASPPGEAGGEAGGV